MTSELNKRFHAKVDIDQITGCHLWTAFRDIKGYGLFGVGQTVRRAHRVAWVIAYGAIPAGIYVLHHCDNPSCVNPKHLFLGTQTDNMQDMQAKGRSNYLRGEDTGRAILCESDVRAIRASSWDKATRERLAAHYGVHIETIKAAQYRRNWRHI